MDNNEFFRAVAEAAFANPFGDERGDLNARIAGQRPGHHPADRYCGLIDAAIDRVAEAVRGLETAGGADVRLYSGTDREVMRTVFMFDVFHRYIDEFDALILRQAAAEDAVCPAPFAGDAISLMGRRGLTREESLRMFSVFYQIRRAFYFINNRLAGGSGSMRRLRMRLWQAVFTHDLRRYETCLWDRMEEFSTLLLGETGTGKGAAAAAIGRSGYIPFDDKRGCFAESFMRNFIPINLSQFPETLIESELFGHKKGAFTGAMEGHDGVFSRCAPHGSIFLDEIGDVSVPVQIKLLRILQERTFSPVGSHARIRFNGRVIAATNRPLDELRRRGDFRDDFYYRISSDIITVPTLRLRLEEDAGELELLVSLLLNRMLGGDAADVAKGPVMEALGGRHLKGYAWPGNVRELEQAVRRILLTNGYLPDTVPAPVGPEARLVSGIETGDLDAETLLSGYCRLLYARHGTYEEVARRTGLDRRTAKKYVESGGRARPAGKA